MRLFDLSTHELAQVVEAAYLADMGEFQVASDVDTLTRLRGFLRGKPELAGQVLDAWLMQITGEEAPHERADAEAWFDRVLLVGAEDSSGWRS